jgi:hypothetical protein
MSPAMAHRHIWLTLLSCVLAACSGGGGGASAPPANPNPAPPTTPLGSINMVGTWTVVSRTITSTNTTETGALDVGAQVLVSAAPGGYFVLGVEIPNVGQAPILQADIEAVTGFPLDWYQNAGDGSLLDFGYGWDRLRVAGGGGSMRDYVQYGVRIVAIGQNLMAGYEAELTQDFLGQPRFEWVAEITLTR